MITNLSRCKSIAKKLSCPHCHGRLDQKTDAFICGRCDRLFPVVNDQVFFDGSPEVSKETSIDLIFRFKSWLKVRPFLFRMAYLAQPAFAVGKGPSEIDSSTQPDPLYLNLGSGAPLYWKAGRTPMIQVDLHAYLGVDLVCDAGRLPFAEGSVDGIYNESLMEHVPDPASIVREVHRVLKPGGKAYFVLPQIAPFHAAPHDFMRWTIPGGKILLSSFALEKCGVRHGPISAWLWQTQETIATLVSFGQSKIYATVLMVLMILTFPIKFLDLIAAYAPDADRVALTLYFLVRKETV